MHFCQNLHSEAIGVRVQRLVSLLFVIFIYDWYLTGTSNQRLPTDSPLPLEERLKKYNFTLNRNDLRDCGATGVSFVIQEMLWILFLLTRLIPNS